MSGAWVTGAWHGIGNQVSSAQGTERGLGTRELEATSMKSQAQGETLVRTEWGKAAVFRFCAVPRLVGSFQVGLSRC